MNIRKYDPKDYPRIKKIIDSVNKIECWPFYHPDGWDAQRTAEEFLSLQEYKDSIFLVAEEDGEIVGLIAGHNLASFVRREVSHLEEAFVKQGLMNGAAYYERDILVDPKHHQKGIGKLLLEKLQAHAQERGYTKLVTRTPPLNDRGQKFFERMRFQEILRDDNPPRIYLCKSIRAEPPIK